MLCSQIIMTINASPPFCSSYLWMSHQARLSRRQSPGRARHRCETAPWISHPDTGCGSACGSTWAAGSKHDKMWTKQQNKMKLFTGVWLRLERTIFSSLAVLNINYINIIWYPKICQTDLMLHSFCAIISLFFKTQCIPMQCNIQLPTTLSHFTFSFSQHPLKNMQRKIIFIIPAVPPTGHPGPVSCFYKDLTFTGTPPQL